MLDFMDGADRDRTDDLMNAIREQGVLLCLGYDLTI